MSDKIKDVNLPPVLERPLTRQLGSDAATRASNLATDAKAAAEKLGVDAGAAADKAGVKAGAAADKVEKTLDNEIGKASRK